MATSSSWSPVPSRFFPQVTSCGARLGASHLEAADRSPSGGTPVRWLMLWAPDGHRNNQQHRITARSLLHHRQPLMRQAGQVEQNHSLVGGKSPASSASVKSHDSEARIGCLWCGGSGHSLCALLLTPGGSALWPSQLVTGEATERRTSGGGRSHRAPH